MPDWKDTLNLPRTDFPMKANLQTAEPQALARWEEMGLYGQHPRSGARDARSSSCTTDRRTPTATSISARR